MDDDIEDIMDSDNAKIANQNSKKKTSSKTNVSPRKSDDYDDILLSDEEPPKLKQTSVNRKGSPKAVEAFADIHNSEANNSKHRTNTINSNPLSSPRAVDYLEARSDNVAKTTSQKEVANQTCAKPFDDFADILGSDNEESKSKQKDGKSNALSSPRAMNYIANKSRNGKEKLAMTNKKTKQEKESSRTDYDIADILASDNDMQKEDKIRKADSKAVRYKGSMAINTNDIPCPKQKEQFKGDANHNIDEDIDDILESDDETIKHKKKRLKSRVKSCPTKTIDKSVKSASDDDSQTSPKKRTKKRAKSSVKNINYFPVTDDDKTHTKPMSDDDSDIFDILPPKPMGSAKESKAVKQSLSRRVNRPKPTINQPVATSESKELNDLLDRIINHTDMQHNGKDAKTMSNDLKSPTHEKTNDPKTNEVDDMLDQVIDHLDHRQFAVPTGNYTLDEMEEAEEDSDNSTSDDENIPMCQTKPDSGNADKISQGKPDVKASAKDSKITASVQDSKSCEKNIADLFLANAFKKDTPGASMTNMHGSAIDINEKTHKGALDNIKNKFGKAKRWLSKKTEKHSIDGNIESGPITESTEPFRQSMESLDHVKKDSENTHGTLSKAKRWLSKKSEKQANSKKATNDPVNDPILPFDQSMETLDGMHEETKPKGVLGRAKRWMSKKTEKNSDDKVENDKLITKPVQMFHQSTESLNNRHTVTVEFADENKSKLKKLKGAAKHVKKEFGSLYDKLSSGKETKVELLSVQNDRECVDLYPDLRDQPSTSTALHWGMVDEDSDRVYEDGGWVDYQTNDENVYDKNEMQGKGKAPKNSRNGVTNKGKKTKRSKKDMEESKGSGKEVKNMVDAWGTKEEENGGEGKKSKDKSKLGKLGRWFKGKKKSDGTPRE